MPVSNCGRQRVASMSSMRRMKRPPAARAASKAVRAEKAWPRCRSPVGEGAKRVMNTRQALAGAVLGREQAHVAQDRVEEGALAAKLFLQVLELLEAGHLGQAMGAAPGRDGGQLQVRSEEHT